MTILEKAEKKIKNATECIKDKYKNISQNKKIKEKTKKYILQSNKLLNESLNVVKNAIKDKPVLSILTAFSIGFILGLWLKKK